MQHFYVYVQVHGKINSFKKMEIVCPFSKHCKHKRHLYDSLGIQDNELSTVVV